METIQPGDKPKVEIGLPETATTHQRAEAEATVHWGSRRYCKSVTSMMGIIAAGGAILGVAGIPIATTGMLITSLFACTSVGVAVAAYMNYQQLSKRLQERSIKSQESEQTVSILQDKNKELTNNLTTSREALNTTKQELLTTKTTLTSKAKHVEQQEIELLSEKTKNTQLQQLIEKSKESEQRSETSQTKLRNELSILRASLNKIALQVKTVISRLMPSQEQPDDMHTDVESPEAFIHGFKTSMEKIETRVQELEADKTRLEETQLRINVEMESITKEKEQLDRDLTEKKKFQEQLVEATEQQKVAQTQLSCQLESANTKRAELETRIFEINEKIINQAQIQSDIATLKSELEQAIEQKKACDSLLAGTQKELSILKEKNNQLSEKERSLELQTKQDKIELESIKSDLATEKELHKKTLTTAKEKEKEKASSLAERITLCETETKKIREVKDQLSKQYSVLESKHTTQKRLMNEYETTISETRQKLDQSTSRCFRLEAELNLAQQSILAEKAQTKTLQETVSDLENTHQTIVSEKQVLQEQLRGIQLQQKETGVKLSQLTSDISKKEEAHSELSTTIATQKAEIHRLTEELDKTKILLAEDLSSKDELVLLADNRNKELQKLKEEFQALSEKLASMNVSSQSLQRELEANIQINETLTTEKADLEQHLKNNKDLLVLEKAERSELQETLSQLENKHDKIERKAQTSQSRIKELQCRLESISQQHQQSSEELAALRSKTSVDSQTAAQEKEDLIQKVESLEKSKNDLTEKVQLAKHSQKSLEQSLLTSNKTQAQLQLELREKEEAVKQLKKNNTELEVKFLEMESIQKSEKEKTEELASIKKAVADYEQQITHLKNQLREAESTLKEASLSSSRQDSSSSSEGNHEDKSSSGYDSNPTNGSRISPATQTDTASSSEENPEDICHTTSAATQPPVKIVSSVAEGEETEASQRLAALTGNKLKTKRKPSMPSAAAYIKKTLIEQDKKTTEDAIKTAFLRYFRTRTLGSLKAQMEWYKEDIPGTGKSFTAQSQEEQKALKALIKKLAIDESQVATVMIIDEQKMLSEMKTFCDQILIPLAGNGETSELGSFTAVDLTDTNHCAVQWLNSLATSFRKKELGYYRMILKQLTESSVVSRSKSQDLNSTVSEQKTYEVTCNSLRKKEKEKERFQLDCFTYALEQVSPWVERARTLNGEYLALKSQVGLNSIEKQKRQDLIKQAQTLLDEYQAIEEQCYRIPTPVQKLLDYTSSSGSEEKKTGEKNSLIKMIGKLGGIVDLSPKSQPTPTSAAVNVEFTASAARTTSSSNSKKMGMPEILRTSSRKKAPALVAKPKLPIRYHERKPEHYKPKNESYDEKQKQKELAIRDQVVITLRSSNDEQPAPIWNLVSQAIPAPVLDQFRLSIKTKHLEKFEHLFKQAGEYSKSVLGRNGKSLARDIMSVCHARKQAELKMSGTKERLKQFDAKSREDLTICGAIELAEMAHEPRLTAVQWLCQHYVDAKLLNHDDVLSTFDQHQSLIKSLTDAPEPFKRDFEIKPMHLDLLAAGILPVSEARARDQKETLCAELKKIEDKQSQLSASIKELQEKIEASSSEPDKLSRLQQEQENLRTKISEKARLLEAKQVHLQAYEKQLDLLQEHKDNKLSPEIQKLVPLDDEVALVEQIQCSEYNSLLRSDYEQLTTSVRKIHKERFDEITDRVLQQKAKMFSESAKKDKHKVEQLCDYFISLLTSESAIPEEWSPQTTKVFTEFKSTYQEKSKDDALDTLKRCNRSDMEAVCYEIRKYRFYQEEAEDIKQRYKKQVIITASTLDMDSEELD